MRFVWCLLAGFAAVSLLQAAVGCGPPGGHADGAVVSVRITGSSTVAPLILAVAERFESLDASARIEVEGGGSGRGIREAISGHADLGMASRALTDDEAAQLVAHTIAYDGVAFVIHGSNGVPDPDLATLRAIYTGGITNWSEIGGADQPIVVGARPEGRSELKLVCEHLGLEPADLRAGVIHGETQQSLLGVARNPGAITFTSIGAAEHCIRSGAAELRLLPLGGVPATSAAVADGRYPLARPLNLLAPRRGTVEAVHDRFRRFAASAAVRDLVADQGFVPVSDRDGLVTASTRPPDRMLGPEHGG